MDKDEALKLALRLCDEALPKFNWGASFLDANAIQLLNTVPAVIKAALAQPAQEPVAWMTDDGRVSTTTTKQVMPDASKESFNIPLYTAPPKRPWVGLAEADFVLINQLCVNPIQSAEFAERLLKEKNYGA